MPDRPEILTAEEARAALESLLAGESLSPESQADILASHERLRKQRDEIWDALDFAARFVRAVFDANDESHVKGEWPREVLARAERALRGRDDA